MSLALWQTATFELEKLSFKLKNFENAPNHSICANINIESVESTESI